MPRVATPGKAGLRRNRVIPDGSCGLLVGRWWIVPLAASGWGVALLAAGTIGAAQLPVAFLLSGVKAAVGLFGHRVLAWLLAQARLHGR
jgi:hypothetical protein